MFTGYKLLYIIALQVLLLTTSFQLTAQSFFDDVISSCEPSNDLVRSVLSPPFETKDTNEFDKTQLGLYVEEINEIFKDLNFQCGSSSFNVQNPLGFKLTATATTGAIFLDVLRCAGGDGGGIGLQIALTSGTRDDIKVVFCESEAVNSNNYPIQATNLIPGEDYYLIFDGYASSICQFRFRQIIGFGSYELTEIKGVSVDNIALTSAVNEFCSGGELNMEVESDNPGFEKAQWIITNKANGSILLDTITGGVHLKYAIMDDGEYDIEVTLKNECSSLDQQFKSTLSLMSAGEEVLDEYSFCVGDFPDIYHPDSRILDPLPDVNATVWNVTVGEGNCVQEIVIPLNPIQEPDVIQINEVFCGRGPHQLDGRIIDGSFIDESFRTNDDPTGCDTLVQYDVKVLYASGQLKPTTCGTIEFDGTIMDENLVQASFNWTDSNGNAVTDSDGNDRIFTASTSGVYSLQLIVSGNNESCAFDFAAVEVDALPASLTLNCRSDDIGSIMISWEEMNGIDSYELIRDGVSVQVFDSSTNSYEDQSIVPGQDYNYSINAELPDGCSISGSSVCNSVSCEDRTFEVSLNQQGASVCLQDNPSPISFTVDIPNTVEQPIISWQSNGVIDENGIFDPVQSGPGTFEVSATVKDKDGCSDTTDKVLVDILGFTQKISFDLTSKDVCEDETVTLSYSGPIVNKELYTITAEGNPTVSGELPDDIELSWPNKGQYQIDIRIDNGECRVQSDIQSLSVSSSQSVKNIQATSNSQSTTFQWEAVSCAEEYDIYINGLLSTTTSNNSFVYIFGGDEERLDFQVGISAGCGCSTLSPITESSKSICPIISIELEEIETICLGENDRLDPIQIVASIRGIEKQGETIWSGNGVNANGLFFPNLAGIGTHTIQLEYIENSCPTVEEIVITIAESFDPTFEIRDPSCPGDASILAIDAVDDYFVFVNEDRQILEEITQLAPGDYSIEFTNDAGCTIDGQFIIEEMPIPDLEITGSQEPTKGFRLDYEIDIEDLQLDVSSIQWTYDGVSICCHQMIGSELT